jgi:HD superfamily phosphohydrolase
VADKIFRDPLYDYISIERPSDGWLVDLLDCPEVQRLRRIHQLGVSNFTYPGADHTRLAHSLGVLHLMQLALGRLRKLGEDEHIRQARARRCSPPPSSMTSVTGRSRTSSSRAWASTTSPGRDR